MGAVQRIPTSLETSIQKRIATIEWNDGERGRYIECCEEGRVLQ